MNHRWTTSDPSTLRNAGKLLGCILLSNLFLMSGIGKLSGYAGTAGYIASVGVPSALLPLVIVLEAT